MRFRFVRRHGLLAGAVLLLCAVVAATRLCGGGGEESESPSSAASFPSAAVSSAASEPAQPPVSSASSEAELAETGAAISGGEEMRGVWVPFMTLDMSGESDKSEAAFRKRFSAIVSGAKSYGMNALIVHVRPFGDALYDSDYVPWSHLSSGAQGVDPGYDPLAMMVELAHAQGLELHAWMNPLRIQMNDTPSVLSQDNPWNLWQGDAEKAGWVVQSGTGKYYNPAYPEVRAQIDRKSVV